MRSFTLYFLLIFTSPSLLYAQVDFDSYFENKTMRIDYIRAGNANLEIVRLDSIFTYGIWAGSKKNLTNSLNYGQSFYKVRDKKSELVIYSKGFDSYFKEYQTTEKAIAGEQKSFFESAILPVPKSAFIFIIEKRDSLNQLHEIFRTEIDPATDAHTLKLNDENIKVFTSLENGPPEKKVDIVIIAEGYTEMEEDKFKKDLERSTVNFFSIEPLKSHKDKFNVRGVFKPSLDSGVSDMNTGIVKNTVVNCAFGALGVDRYLLTEDIKAVSDIAAYAPYDAIFILVNSKRYGGGGIYNFYCTFTSDDVNSGFLMVHEFGHSFFGLGDEYYTSSTAYTNFYPEGYEPLVPNVTANADSASIKWKSLLSDSIEVPTHWQKAKYDSSEIAWQKEAAKLQSEIAKLEKRKVSKSQISTRETEYQNRNMAHHAFIKGILTDPDYKGKVGAFEGAGYAPTGLYRPSLSCIMFRLEDYFCPVCTDAMIQVINYYTAE